jgi:oligo-1,6-glucosidase
VQVGNEWWRSAVVYQIYPRSFADADGDGIGDLRGIAAHLDHLADLGVDVIWLSPVYPSPQDDNGYDISDYQGIDRLFGTLDDFDDLLGAVHARGMKLVMDLVVNHTSDEHPWFVESRSGPDSPKRDWYWWRKGRSSQGGGDGPPTNWESFFSGSTWELDPASGEYYLHLFSRKQPDLNWENPRVRAAVYEMMRWWLDRGVDGFRMDVVNLLSKVVAADGSLPDGPVREGYAFGSGFAFYNCGPRIHEFLAEMNREVFAGRPDTFLTVGEMPGVTVAEARLFTDPARREVDMVFQFEHVGLDQGVTKWDLRPIDLVELKASLGRWQEGLAATGWNSLYWDNHDQPRAVSRFGSDAPEHRVASAKLLATVLHLQRGTPYVYQGEELGMTNTVFSDLAAFQDIESVNFAAFARSAGLDEATTLTALRAMSRDNARTPVQWDATENAGFTSGVPWIPVNPNHREINAAEQWKDPGSVLHHYRALIELRHTEPAVVHGDFTMLVPDHPTVFAFTRRLDDVELLVVANFADGPTEVPLPDAGDWDTAELLSTSVVDSPAAAGSSPLRPWEARLLRRIG